MQSGLPCRKRVSLWSREHLQDTSYYKLTTGEISLVTNLRHTKCTSNRKPPFKNFLQRPLWRHNIAKKSVLLSQFQVCDGKHGKYSIMNWLQSRNYPRWAILIPATLEWSVCCLVTQSKDRVGTRQDCKIISLNNLSILKKLLAAG